jgi:TPR repeat protein
MKMTSPNADCFRIQQIYDWVITNKNGYVEPKSCDILSPFNILSLYSDLQTESKPTDEHTLAFEWFKKAAEQVCAEAQYWLARCYDAGLGCSQNEELAFTWLKKAAEQGFAEAYYYLASCYRDGKGVAQNDLLAFDWITKAAELADVYLSPTKSVSDYGRHVAEVYFFLGGLYAQGKGVAQSDELAFECYGLAARYGVTHAYLLVGDLAAQGKGCEQDDKLAFKCYKLATEYDVDNIAEAEAKYLLACCLNEGGTWQNYNIDQDWFEELADQGKPEASYLLGYLWEHGFISNQEDEDDMYMDTRAFEYYKAAVKQFEHTQEESKVKDLALKALANCFEKNKGVWPTDEKIAEQYSKIAEQYYQQIGREKLEQLNLEEIKTIPPRSRKALEFLYPRIMTHISKGEFSLAEQFVEEVFTYPNYKETSMKEISLTTIKQAKASQKALHEKEKEMLSFFTHTMRNALATAPESLRQAIHLLGSEVYEKDTKHYQAINKIASLFSTLSLTDCLIDTFKQSISDPQEFTQSWQKDHTGEATPKWVIASALRQSLNRIIFMSDTSELRKLLDNPETALIKATRKSFIEEVLPLNVDSQGVDVFYDWTLTHIPAIEVSITDSDKLNFGVNQSRFSLLFAITSELILNALKYWDGENRIQISWQLAEQGSYVFSVKNHCKANATSNLSGTHKGLAFIKRLVELLGEQAQFVCKNEGQFFTAELILNKVLFDGGV